MTSSAEIDHIKPLHKGGTNARENLQGLCVECHKAKTALEHRDRLGGYPGCDAEGNPLTPKTHWAD